MIEIKIDFFKFKLTKKKEKILFSSTKIRI